jgi:hypothetical protein
MGDEQFSSSLLAAAEAALKTGSTSGEVLFFDPDASGARYYGKNRQGVIVTVVTDQALQLFHKHKSLRGSVSQPLTDEDGATPTPIAINSGATDEPHVQYFDFTGGTHYLSLKKTGVNPTRVEIDVKYVDRDGLARG